MLSSAGIRTVKRAVRPGLISEGVVPVNVVAVDVLAAVTERVSSAAAEAAAAVRIEIAKIVFHIKRLPIIRAEIQAPWPLLK